MYSILFSSNQFFGPEIKWVGSDRAIDVRILFERSVAVSSTHWNDNLLRSITRTTAR